MQIFIALSALAGASFAFIVCPPDACKNLQQPVLNCRGSTIQAKGWCGCPRNYCAKQLDESCQISPFSNLGLLGVPDTEEKCEDGLECRDLNLEGHSTPTCVDPSKNDDDLKVSKRQEGFDCLPDACDNVQKVLICKGGILRNTGRCGCFDVCKKVHMENCVPDSDVMDTVNTEVCDDGLVCQRLLEAKPICLKPDETSTFVSKRSTTSCDTPCRKKSQMCTLSFVIYEGQWFARCDLEGNFLPQQCNNKGECFCVDQSGTIDESTRVLGSAKCS